MAASTVIPADTFLEKKADSDVPSMKRHILDKGYLDKHKNQVDYQEEAWYKASYIANDEKAANDFIDMIIAGKDERKVETMPYRQYMQRGFDGKVCERIASFIEDNLK